VKNLTRYRQKCWNVFMWSTRYSCWILIKLEFSRQIFGKSSDLKFYQNPFGGELFHTDGQTDMTKLIVAFCNLANASIYMYVYVYVCIYMLIYVYVRMCLNICVCVCVCVYIWEENPVFVFRTVHVTDNCAFGEALVVRRFVFRGFFN
jgi:hypothetical protein